MYLWEQLPFLPCKNNASSIASPPPQSHPSLTSFSFSENRIPCKWAISERMRQQLHLTFPNPNWVLNRVPSWPPCSGSCLQEGSQLSLVFPCCPAEGEEEWPARFLCKHWNRWQDIRPWSRWLRFMWTSIAPKLTRFEASHSTLWHCLVGARSGRGEMNSWDGMPCSWAHL